MSKTEVIIGLAMAIGMVASAEGLYYGTKSIIKKHRQEKSIRRRMDIFLTRHGLDDPNFDK